MGLGWKISSDGVYGTFYINEKSEKKIGIFENSRNVWIIATKDLYGGKWKNKSFKTKSHAVEYLKSYMANHGASPVEQVEAKLKRMAGF